MKSKIIKVSIILIFLMFSAGLFNFCFAWEIGTDIIETNSVSYNYVNSITGKADLKFANFNYSLPNIEPTVDNIKLDSSTASDSVIQEFISAYNTFPHVKYINNNEYPDSILYYFPRYSSDMIFYQYSATGSSFSMYYSDFTSASISTDYGCACLRYDYSEQQWYFKFNSTIIGNFTYNSTQKVYDGYYIIENNAFPIYDYNKNLIYEPVQEPSINMEVNQTGTKTGHVTFTPENWDSHMYYIKDNMDELVRLIAEEELSPIHDKVKLYNGPISIEKDEYVMGILFDDNGTMIFSKISDTLELDSDIIFDDTHRLRIDKSDLDTYYLFVHSPQEGDYIKVSSVPNTASDFNNKAVIINGAMSYNGLSIRSSFINGFNQLTREINITKNTVNYFYLYDVNNNLVDSAVLNTSNYYDGSDFKFDVELQYGSSSSRTNPVLAADDIGWCKVIPTYSVDNVDDVELYFRMTGYHEMYDSKYPLFISKDDKLDESIPYDTENKSKEWIRIDNQFNKYFFICTMISDNFARFELELRTKDGQVIQNKGFSIYITPKAKNSYTGDMTVDGESVLDNVLSGVTSNNGNFDFSGLNKLSEDDLKTNLTGLIDNSIGFFGLVSTFLLLLPNWISSLLYLFFFGIIVITLLRFIRGS